MEQWFIDNAAAAAIILTLLGGLWMIHQEFKETNAKFTSELNVMNDKFVAELRQIDKRLTTIETVLIMHNMMPMNGLAQGPA